MSSLLSLPCISQLSAAHQREPVVTLYSATHRQGVRSTTAVRTPKCTAEARLPSLWGSTNRCQPGPTGQGRRVQLPKAVCSPHTRPCHPAQGPLGPQAVFSSTHAPVALPLISGWLSTSVTRLVTIQSPGLGQGIHRNFIISPPARVTTNNPKTTTTTLKKTKNWREPLWQISLTYATANVEISRSSTSARLG